jgi:hypothetical protein
METFNRILDWAVLHQVRLMQLAILYQAQAQEELDSTEPELSELGGELAAYLVARGGLRLDDTTAQSRVERAVQGTLALRRRGFTGAITSLNSNLVQLADYERQFFEALMRAGGRNLSPSLSVDVTGARVMGNTMRDWQNRLLANDIQRLQENLLIGAHLGENEAAMRARLVGHTSYGGRDGATATARRELDTLVRGATDAFADLARVQAMLDNPYTANKEVYAAILDGRTTVECRDLHGNVYDADAGPRPPIHWGCRSIRVPLVGDGSTRLPGYREWLNRLSNADQNEVLGRRQAQAFREGRLDLTTFREPNWRGIDLETMAKRERQVFEAAGMEPPFQ